MNQFYFEKTSTFVQLSRLPEINFFVSVKMKIIEQILFLTYDELKICLELFA